MACTQYTTYYKLGATQRTTKKLEIYIPLRFLGKDGRQKQQQCQNKIALRYMKMRPPSEL